MAGYLTSLIFGLFIFQERLDHLPCMVASGQHSKKVEVDCSEQVTRPAQLPEGGGIDSPGWEGRRITVQSGLDFGMEGIHSH